MTRKRLVTESAFVGIGCAVLLCGCSSGSSPAGPTSPPALPSSIVVSAASGLMGATQFTFSLSGTGSPAYQCAWDFGDGSVASGSTVSHVYDREGAFEVVATPAGQGSNAALRTTVTIRGLAGAWHANALDMVLTHSSAVVGGTFRWISFPAGTVDGRVTHPSNIQLVLLREGQFQLELQVTANANVDVLTGTYALCREGGGGCAPPEGITFRRP